MKYVNFIIALCAAWSVSAQRPVSAGGYVGGYDCNMAGEYTGEKSRSAVSGALWVEWNAEPWFGLKSELSYLPRGGEIGEGIDLEANYLAFSLVPRLHLSEVSGGARLVAGVGVFTHLLALGDREEFLSVPDVGTCVELGVEWRWFSILAKGQVGLLDAIEGLDKSQRWVGFGIGVEVPFFH